MNGKAVPGKIEKIGQNESGKGDRSSAGYYGWAHQLIIGGGSRRTYTVLGHKINHLEARDGKLVPHHIALPGESKVGIVRSWRIPRSRQPAAKGRGPDWRPARDAWQLPPRLRLHGGIARAVSEWWLQSARVVPQY